MVLSLLKRVADKAAGIVQDNFIEPAQEAIYNWGVQNPKQTEQILQLPQQIQRTIGNTVNTIQNTSIPISNILPRNPMTPVANLFPQQPKISPQNILNNLNPQNFNTPIIGNIRQFNQQTFGTPAWQKPLNQQTSQDLIDMAQGFSGVGFGTVKNKVGSELTEQFVKNPRIAEIQKRILQLGKKAPKVIEEKIPFSETDEGIRIAQQKVAERTAIGIQKAAEEGYHPGTIQKLVDEGYDPSVVRNILNRALDKNKLKSDSGYSYNFFKKAAKNEGIKPSLKPKTPITAIISPVVQTGEKIINKTKEQFKKTVEKAKTRVDVDNIYNETTQRVKQLEDFYISKGKSFDQVVDELESGIKNSDTKALENFFDMFKKIAERSTKIDIPTRKNFFTHLSEERIQDILNNPSAPDGFGSTLLKPFFAYQRSGSLKDYSKTPQALLAYAKEALKNVGLDPNQKAEIDLGQKIVNAYKERIGFSQVFTKGNPIRSAIDVVSIIQKDFRGKFQASGRKSKVIYDGANKSAIREGFSTTLRSNNDRAAQAGDKFYKAFAEPFRRVEMEVNRFAQTLDQSNMSEKDFMRAIMRKDGELRAEAAEIFKENVRNANFKQGWLKDLANSIFDEQIGNTIITPNFAEKVLGQVRAGAGRGALGVNIASAVNNIFELKRAFSLVGTKESSKALKRVLSGEDLTKKYGIDSVSSTALERLNARNALGQVMDKFDKGLFYMFDKAENLKDNMMLAAFEEQALAKNLKGEELTRFVIQKFDKYAIKYGKGNDVGAYRNPVFKTLFQFGQYVLKDAVIFADKTKGAVTGNKGDMSYLGKYAAASAAQMMIFKAVLDRVGFGDQTNTPVDVISNFSKGTFPITPAVVALFGLGQNLTDQLTGNELDDFDQEQRDKGITRSLSTATIPASNQLYFKSGKTIENQMRGYQEKYGGNIANPVSNDPLNLGRSLLFGPSYDSKRQDYIEAFKKEGSGGLDKTQSAVFKNLPRSQQTEFYDQSLATNKADQTNQEILKSIENPEEPNFIERLFGKKEEKGPVWGKTPTTSDERKDHKALVTASLEAGIDVPEKDLRVALFKDKTYKDATKGEQTEILNTLVEYIDNPDLSDEVKVKMANAVGVDNESLKYYRFATVDETERLEGILEFASNTQDRDQLLTTIALGKRKVGGKAIVSTTMVDRLYDEGLISKEEKALMTAIKYDSVYDKFYMDRDYKGSGGGMSNSQRKSYITKVNSIYKDIIKSTKIIGPGSLPKAPKLNLPSTTSSAKPRLTKQLFTSY